AGAPQHVNDVLTVPTQWASACQVLGTKITGRAADHAARADRVAHECIDGHLRRIRARGHTDQTRQVLKNAAGRFADARIGWWKRFAPRWALIALDADLRADRALHQRELRNVLLHSSLRKLKS